MGCDIHFFVEKKINGSWKSIDRWRQENNSIFPEESLYSERNYDFYAILAGVRNYSKLNPISTPKGIPVDSSFEVEKCFKGWGFDAHSASWFTVSELINFNWTQMIEMEAIFSVMDFLEWKESRAKGLIPAAASYNVLKWNKIVDEKEMDELLKPFNHYSLYPKIKEEFKDYGVRCFWHQPYYGLAEDFFSFVLPRLFALGKPDDVRVVFWFDN